MKLSKLKINERNPRSIKTEAFKKLCDSIQRDPEFMTLRPIVTDETGLILGGNMRFRACQSFGMKEIPDTWVIKAADLNEEQKRRFILVDNAPEGMAGDWDFDILSADWEVPELEELGFDVKSFEPTEESQEPSNTEKSITCPECGHEFTI